MINKRYFTLILVSICAALLTSFSTKDRGHQQKSRLRKIVIDPGHGGHDGGAPGKYSNEKDVALAISLKLEEMLKDQIPDIELVLTRRIDVYDSPIEKAKIANQAKGDLFVCIHCNSADAGRRAQFVGYKTETYHKGHKKLTRRVKEYKYTTIPSAAKGTETYIWGAHKNESKEVAMRDNQSLYLDSNASKSVKGFDESPEQMNFINIKTRQYFDRSAYLALTIQEEFAKAGRINRDALQRQVGIWVLQAVAMPAVLVETGYISNPEEEDYLNSPTGQKEIAQSIINAIKRYRTSLDNKTISADLNSGK